MISDSQPHTKLLKRLSSLIGGVYVTGAMVILITITKPARAVDEFADLKIIRELPTTEREIESAHRRSRSEACENLPAGEPVELSSFMTYLTERDRRSRRDRPIPSTRRNLFSVGLEIPRRDQRDLPLVSRGSILEYLQDHHVVIQARVRRDLLDRKLYFHHRPIALTANYRGPRLTQAFEPVVAQSIKEFHSLGLFLEEYAREKPENLRTIVLLFRNELLSELSGRAEEQYEFVFIQASESEQEQGSRRRAFFDNDEQAASLDVDVFVTSENRSKLHHLLDYGQPRTPSRCSILGQIAITEFDSSGIYPRKSMTRGYRLRDRAEYAMSELDQFCQQHDLGGGFGAHVPTVLKAILAGEIRSSQ